MPKNNKTTLTITDSIPDDDGSGFVLVTRKQLRNGKINNIIIFIVIFLGAMYLYSHMLFHVGSLKERASKQCVDAYAMKQWEETIDITKAICVDVPVDLVGEIKSNYEVLLGNCENDVKHWQDSYYWYKKQTEVKIEEEDN